MLIIGTEEHEGLKRTSTRVFLREKQTAEVTPFSAEGDLGRFGKGTGI